jgi:hypothetical protein
LFQRLHWHCILSSHAELPARQWSFVRWRQSEAQGKLVTFVPHH